ERRPLPRPRRGGAPLPRLARAKPLARDAGRARDGERVRPGLDRGGGPRRPRPAAAGGGRPRRGGRGGRAPPCRGPSGVGRRARARLAVVALGEGSEAAANSRAEGIRRSLDARGFFGLKEIVAVGIESLPAGSRRAPDEVTIARALDDPAACVAWAKEVAKAL